MANEYGWIDFYTELADKLLPYKDSRPELIRKVRQVYANVGIKLPKLENDNNPKDIDPFTVFGLFNKGISNANRIAIIKGISYCEILHWLVISILQFNFINSLKKESSFGRTLKLSMIMRLSEWSFFNSFICLSRSISSLMSAVSSLISI